MCGAMPVAEANTAAVSSCHPQVVVTQTLDWKLAHFDLVSEHQFASQYDLPLAAAAWLLPAQYKAGEVAKGDWQVRGCDAVM